MTPRQRLPRLWMLTDERQGDALWPALARLPRGSGVVFRHYRTAEAERRALCARLLRIAHRRGLVVVGAGPPCGRARAFAGCYGARRPRRTLTALWIATAHGRREIIAGARAGADLVMLSPLYPTRSHPGARALGASKAGLAARGAGVPVVALGGMDAAHARRLPRFIHGWAAIDGWMGKNAARQPRAIRT